MNSFLRSRCKGSIVCISGSLIRQYTVKAKTPSFVRRLKTFKQIENAVFRVSEEVKDAVESFKPVVALETTIYTHGFPYPDNVSLAHDLETIVRNNGGIPATIGILNGVACVGLTSEQLTEIASAAGDPETRKVSRRDIPFLLGMVRVM
jgi:pseudouridine-5'-phosphate glycosidase/pseudouridine kinase